MPKKCLEDMYNISLTGKMCKCLQLKLDVVYVHINRAQSGSTALLQVKDFTFNETRLCFQYGHLTINEDI